MLIIHDSKPAKNVIVTEWVHSTLPQGLVNCAIGQGVAGLDASSSSKEDTLDI